MHGRPHGHRDRFQIEPAGLALILKTSRSSALTSRLTFCRIACAVFFLRSQRVFDGSCATDFLVDLEQFTAQFPEAGKCLDFALRFAQFGGRSEGLADRFSIFFARQPEVGAVAGLVWLMTTALRFTTAATDSSDGTAAKITQIDNTRQNGTALVFEVTRDSDKCASNPNVLLRKENDHKKGTAYPFTFMSHTP
jgi:hypothetical protein